jgi:hypothetical protein
VGPEPSAAGGSTLGTKGRKRLDTAIIFVIATGGVAAVVWWASIPHDPAQTKSRPRPRLRFQETFQTTGPEPVRQQEDGDGFVMMTSGSAAPVVTDDRPNRALSVVRLALTIAVVSILGVALLGGLGLFLFRLIDGYFARGGS